MPSRSDELPQTPTATRAAAAPEIGARAPIATAREGELLCPICYHVIPPEQIGHKLYCRRCGYLESCCHL